MALNKPAPINTKVTVARRNGQTVTARTVTAEYPKGNGTWYDVEFLDDAGKRTGVVKTYRPVQLTRA